MNTIRRILIAIAGSFLFNILLLVVSAGNDGRNSSRFWQAIDFVSRPSTLVAQSLFPNVSIEEMVFTSMMVSTVYFGLLIWLALTLFFSLRTSVRRHR
jgi:hypothetical protein